MHEGRRWPPAREAEVVAGSSGVAPVPHSGPLPPPKTPSAPSEVVALLRRIRWRGGRIRLRGGWIWRRQARI